MKRFLPTVLLCALLCAAVLHAAVPRTFTLPVSTDGGATLTAFLPEQPSGRALLAFPGGGYRQTSIGNNAQWAPFYNERGIAFFILKYRMPEGNPRIPLSDAEVAMRLIRDSAAVWHVNPSDIGVMGTSADGHLATTFTARAEASLRPAFQILFYPVITFGQGCHQGSRDHFLGRDSTNVTLQDFYSSEKQVSRSTPPAILFANEDDRGVPPETNAAAYARALRANGRAAELHIYPEGGHGWTFASPFRYHDDVVSALSDWLAALPSGQKKDADPA